MGGSKADRAMAVSSAWGGFVDDRSLCPDSRRLDVMVGTHVACRIPADAVVGGAGAVSAALRTRDFNARIISRTETILVGSDALQGDLELARTAAEMEGAALGDGQSGK